MCSVTADYMKRYSTGSGGSSWVIWNIQPEGVSFQKVVLESVLTLPNPPRPDVLKFSMYGMKVLMGYDIMWY